MRVVAGIAVIFDMCAPCLLSWRVNVLESGIKAASIASGILIPEVRLIHIIL